MSTAADPRPTVGLFVLAGDSWWEMGVCDATAGRYAGFMPKVEQDVRNIREALEADFQVVSSGIVHTVEAAVAEARRFNEARVDAVLYAPIIWTNDQRNLHLHLVCEFELLGQFCRLR